MLESEAVIVAASLTLLNGVKVQKAETPCNFVRSREKQPFELQKTNRLWDNQDSIDK